MIPCHADGDDVYDRDEYIKNIPGDVYEYITDEDIENGSFTLSALGQAAGKMLSSAVSDIIKTVPSLLLLIICCAVCCSLSGGSMKGAARTFSGIILLIYTFGMMSGVYSSVRCKVDELVNYGAALSGAMGSFLVFGGGTNTAGVVLTFMAALCTLITYATKYIFPAVCALILLTSVSRIGKRNGFSGAAKYAGGAYMTVCCAVVSLLSLVVSFQTKVSASADSMVLKSAKIASAYAIPVVGGVISESVDNISGGFGLIRASFGMGAACIIVVTVLPVIIKILACKMIFAGIGIFCEIAGVGECYSAVSDADMFFNVLLITVAVDSIAYLYAVLLFCGAECGL